MASRQVAKPNRRQEGSMVGVHCVGHEELYLRAVQVWGFTQQGAVLLTETRVQFGLLDG